MTFNRRFADQISAHREAFTPPLVEPAREGRVFGWRDGGYVVEVDGSRSIRQAATNGSIPVGGVACVRGRVDAQPAIAPQPRRRQVRVDSPAGKVRFFVQTSSSGENIHYVGGDRKDLLELFRLPFGVQYHFAFISTGIESFYYQVMTAKSTGFELLDSRYPSPIIFPESHRFLPIDFSGGGYLGDGIWALYGPSISPISGALLEQSLYRDGQIQNFSSPPELHELRYWQGEEIASTKYYPNSDLAYSYPLVSENGWAAILNRFMVNGNFGDIYFSSISPEKEEKSVSENPENFISFGNLKITRNFLSIKKLYAYDAIPNMNSLLGNRNLSKLDFAKINLRNGARSWAKTSFYPIKNTDPTLGLLAIQYI